MKDKKGQVNKAQVALPSLQLFLTKAKTIEDEKLSPDEFKDKYVIVNFWASWCAPCMSETPGLLKFVESNKDKVMLLAISEDDSLKDIKSFLKLFPRAKNKNVKVIHDSDRFWSQGFLVNKFPETFIYGPNFVFIKKIEGAIDFLNPSFEKTFQSSP